MNPVPLILSSPSGGGKTTIARMLLERRPDVGYWVSCTTRAPRPGERDGKDYYFLSTDEFAAMRSRDEFAELQRLEAACKQLERATLKLFQDADHSFHVPARTGRKDSEIRAELVDAMASWIGRIMAGEPR